MFLNKKVVLTFAPTKISQLGQNLAIQLGNRSLSGARCPNKDLIQREFEGAFLA